MHKFAVIGGQVMRQRGYTAFYFWSGYFCASIYQENFDKINAALADEFDMDVEKLDIQTSEGQTLKVKR